MLFKIKGKLADGRTISGLVSGANMIEATAGFITKNQLPAADLGTLSLSSVSEDATTAKVRAPRAPRKSTNGATAADKAAGANQIAAATRENAKDAAKASPRR